MGQYDAEESRIARQRAIAQALRESGNVSFDPAASAGRLVYKRSAWEDIAKALNQGMGAYADRKGDKLTEALAKRKQSDAKAGVESSLDALVGASQKGMPQTADNPAAPSFTDPMSLAPQEQRLGPSMHVPAGTTAPFPGLTEKNTKREKLANVLRGIDPEQAAGVLQNEVLKRELAQPAVKDDYTVGATRFSGKDNRVLATDPVALETRKAKEAKDTEESAYRRRRDETEDQFRERQIASLEAARKASIADVGESDFDPVRDAPIVAAIAEGKLGIGNAGTGRKPGFTRDLQNAVLTKNPNWSADGFSVRQRTRGNFTNGLEGRTTRALNAVIEHMDTFDEYVDALNKGDTQLINKLENEFSRQFGGKSIKGADAIRQVVASEIAKATIPQAGTGEERERFASTLAAELSKGQSKEVLSAYYKLLGGQLSALRNQYAAGVSVNSPVEEGVAEFDSKLLTARTKKLFNEGANADAAPDAPVKVATEEEYNKLAPGTEYIAPDGSHKRKK